VSTHPLRNTDNRTAAIVSIDRQTFRATLKEFSFKRSRHAMAMELGSVLKTTPARALLEVCNDD